jgi:hypothetical protein
MRVVLGGQPATEAANRDRSTWADMAQEVYGFERQTARRLAFVRWLVQTGRLGDLQLASEQRIGIAG